MPSKKPQETQPKRSKVDWDAVERDYRTGKFTLRELADKYGCSHAAIAKQVKKNGWTQDLSKAVKAATNAKLIAESVSKEVAKSAQAVTNTVLAAAELNKQVILLHRGDLRQARDAALELLAELRQTAFLAENADRLVSIIAGDEPDADAVSEVRRAIQRALSLQGRIGGIRGLAEAITKLQAAERKAFGLDDEDSDSETEPAEVLREFLGHLHGGAGRLPVVPPKGAKPAGPGLDSLVKG